MFHLVEIVRKMLVSGAHWSGGGTFSQPPPPFVSHATARTPRAHRRGPANAAASLSFTRPSPRPTLDWTPGAARASPARHEASRGVRDQQVFEKLFKFVGKNLKNIVDRADQPHCFRLHKKVRRARVQPPRSPRVARFARSLRTSRRGRKPTPTRERGDRLSGGSGGARTFFSRARRSFPPVRAFRAFATAAQPDSIPRVSDSSDEEISALPNGFGR